MGSRGHTRAIPFCSRHWKSSKIMLVNRSNWPPHCGVATLGLNYRLGNLESEKKIPVSKMLHILHHLHSAFRGFHILCKFARHSNTSLYEDIILSIASAPEANKFRAVVKASVRSLTIACFGPSSRSKRKKNHGNAKVFFQVIVLLYIN